MSRAILQNQQQAFYGHQSGYAPAMRHPGGRGGELGGEGGGGDSGGAKPQSRLLRMRDDYQKKLLKEKEERMVHMYEENSRKNQERAERLTRPGGSNAYPNSRLRPPGHNPPPQSQIGGGEGGAPSSVRDFFRERRELEARGGYVPPIDHHYKHARSRTGSGHSSLGSKNSAGVDRAQPLAPIQPRAAGGGSSAHSQQQQSPFNNKPRLVKRGAGHHGVAPATDENDNYVSKTPAAGDNGTREAGVGPAPRAAPAGQAKGPPNADRGVRRPGGQGPKEVKMTDFQQWQQEQSRSREDRLKKLNQRSPPSQREGYEYDEAEDEDETEERELSTKQHELMERINRQQAELERLRKERETEEKQDRLEAEAAKKQQMAERERRRRQQEEAARRRQEEEEDQRKASRGGGRQPQQRQRHDEDADDHEDEDDAYGSQRAQPAAKPRATAAAHQAQRKQPDPSPAARQGPQRRGQPPPQRRPQPQEEEEEEEEVPGPGIDIYANAEDEGPEGRIRLLPCKLCGRKFAEERLAKHQEACKKLQKKRKALDPIKMRTEGTDMAKYVSRGLHKQEPTKKKKADWRRQHEEFINNIRYAKKVTHLEAQGVDVRDLTPPPPSHNPDLVACPHCGRTFNEQTAERHIPRCKDLKTKPATTKRR